MRIAVMLRALDQDSGHTAIISGLVENLLPLNRGVEYLLFYRTAKYIGRFSHHPNAREILVKAPGKAVWDQIAVPWRAWREGADVIYHPKFSVPLVSSCPVVMGLQEPAWWAWPQHYEWLDRTYMKLFLPLYIRKSAHLFPISQFVVDETRKYTSLPPEKTTVAYAVPKSCFKPVQDPDALVRIRRQHNLPERFVLSVTRVLHVGLDGEHSFFPGKNPETTVRAFQMIRDQVPHKLVLAGSKVREYLLHCGMDEESLGDVHFLGFVPHEDLPALLSLADLFVLPSYYESYAMALVEAMSCGCPVVASQTGACPEITAGAALLADPHEPEDMARKMHQVLTDAALQEDLRARSLRRAADFSGERTAAIVLEQLKKIVQEHGGPRT